MKRVINAARGGAISRSNDVSSLAIVAAYPTELSANVRTTNVMMLRLIRARS